MRQESKRHVLEKQTPLLGLQKGNGTFFPVERFRLSDPVLSTLEFHGEPRGQDWSGRNEAGGRSALCREVPGACRQPLPPRTSKAKQGKPRKQTSRQGCGQMCSSSRQTQTKFIKKASQGHSKLPAGLIEVTIPPPVSFHSSLIGAFQIPSHPCVQEGK